MFPPTTPPTYHISFNFNDRAQYLGRRGVAMQAIFPNVSHTLIQVVPLTNPPSYSGQDTVKGPSVATLPHRQQVWLCQTTQRTVWQKSACPIFYEHDLTTIADPSQVLDYYWANMCTRDHCADRKSLLTGR